ncbi:MAG: hypothetical protein KJO21_04890 [Verrucomicrobiae bacterium]|nr:hypothetical protein [Verrucomicrobiae bacterium]NNJ43059.1 hypothetical protein [Akkermansiaceae bacterium]
MLQLATDQDAVLVLGTQTRRDDESWYNTALTLDGQGAVGEHYKNHTVHFFDDGTSGEDVASSPSTREQAGCFRGS